MSERFLTTVELARELKVSPRTVDRWRRAGMPSELWGPALGTRRFPLEAALEWVRAGAAATVPQHQIDRGRMQSDPGNTGGCVSHARQD
jgi:phage terminase Nu1 subunit (DNA packaging protein)